MNANYGIDYGNGSTNIDTETGIRYGVIPVWDIAQAWYDSSEAEYGEPICPKCGMEAHDLNADDLPDDIPDLDNMPADWQNDGIDFACTDCKYTFDASKAFGDEPIGYSLDDGEYRAWQGSDDTDIFITKSPYYTHARFCSPCAPGACYLRSVADTDGPKAYCFAPDFFDYWQHEGCGPTYTGEYNGEPTSCPYPVYRVADGACVFTPTKPQED